MDIIKFYKKAVLPWRQKAELAEVRLKHMSNLVNKLSHQLAEELDKNRR